MKTIQLSLVLVILACTYIQAQKEGTDYAFLFYNTSFSKGWTALPDTEAETLQLAKELEENYNFKVKRYGNLNLNQLRIKLGLPQKACKLND